MSLTTEKFADVLAYDIGGGWGSETENSDSSDPAYVIRGTDIPRVIHGDVSTVPLRFHAPSNLRSRALQPDDIIFEVSGGSRGQPVGRALRVTDRVLAKFDEPVMCASFCKLLRIDRAAAEPGFVFRVLQAAYSDGRLDTYQVQSTGITNFKWKPFLEHFQLDLPASHDQRSVAAILDALDDMIENNRRRVEVLEEMARAIFREWFVHFRFPGHENVALVDSALGLIPVGCQVLTLGEVSRNHDRRRRPLSKMEREARRGMYPYYGAAKLIDWIDGWIFDGEYLLFAEDGSVQTPEGFPVLQLVEGKFWANNHTHILEGNGVSTRFLKLASERVSIRGYVTGAAQPKITQANLNRIPILVGPLPVHEAFESCVNPMFDQARALRRQADETIAVRDLLLPKLVTGQVDVSRLDQDALIEGAVA